MIVWEVKVENGSKMKANVIITHLQGRILTISHVLNVSIQTGHSSANSPSKILSKSDGRIVLVGILSIAFLAALFKRL